MRVDEIFYISFDISHLPLMKMGNGKFDGAAPAFMH
jgi:hypothetical protein